MNVLLLAVLSAAPTFHEDVQPILFAKCVVCHHVGEVAPFALLTYDDAFKHAKQIAGATHEKYMPPWKPVAGWGEFRDARGLTDAEIATLSKWYEAGAPEGDKKKEPPAPKFQSGWRLGPPDKIVKMPEAFSIYAKGEDIYRAFVVPLGFDKDVDVAAAEFHPGNPKVDHHALLWLDANGKAREKDAADPGPGYKSFGGPGFIPSGGLGGWAPGATPRLMPDGVAYHVQKGSDLVIAMHYHPTGKAETDQSEVGLYFSRKPAEKRVQSLMLLQRDLHIPAGEKAFKTSMEFTTPIDLELLGAAPHMHLLGQSMKIWATLPDKSELKLIRIDDWDFNWQGSYLYDKPVKLPKGSVIHLEAVYDNSTDNAANPNDPPKEVSWGEQTTDEMCLAFLSYATTRPEDRKDLFIALVKQLQLWRFRSEFKK